MNRKEEKWVVIAKGADFERIGKRYGVNPVIARVVRNRDVVTEDELEEFFHPTLEKMHNPSLLKDGEKAATLLKEAIIDKKKIAIIGDYDIDGIQSTYLLHEGLRQLGGQVFYEIPDRMLDGYGLNRHLVDVAVEKGAQVILTCDNGIAARDEIAYAKSLGLTVIVTDHHEVPYEDVTQKERVERQYLLPPADAVVDPKRADCSYPFKELCGAGVAFKVLQLVYVSLGHSMEETFSFLENVAFATIGDVMVLKGENRILVTEGLKALNQTSNLGMQALIAENQLEESEIKSYHVGFVLGPCMNASGRLDTAKRTLAMLLAEQKETALKLAKDLVDLNNNRKELTLQGVVDAHAYIETHGLMEKKVFVIYLPDCHESIAGIIAGRIREQYYRPVFVLTKGEQCIKGSGRSIEGYSMYEEMVKCSHLFLKFGGHPMAAGLSIEEENIEKLDTFLNEQTTLTDEELVEKIRIDVPMPLHYIDPSLVEQLQVLEPCGNGNEKPIFAVKNVQAKGYRRIGKNQNMLKLSLLAEDGQTVDGLYFGDAEEFLSYYEQKYGRMQMELLEAGKASQVRFSFIYYPQVNSYNGRDSIQIVISNYC